MRLRPALLVFVVVVLAVGAAFVAFFERLPVETTSLAIDWRAFHQGVANGVVTYASVDGLRVPPWSVLFIVPLGFLTFKASYGVLALVTFAALMFSVPRVFPRWRHWTSVVLLCVSFPALRVAADGNFEGLIVAGVALMVWAVRRNQALVLALGALLATFKPQAVGLFVGVVALALVFDRSRRGLALRAGVIAAAVVGVTMLWQGGAWLTALLGENYSAYTGNALDVSIGAALRRAGLPALVGEAVRLVVMGVSVWAALDGGRGAAGSDDAGVVPAGSRAGMGRWRVRVRPISRELAGMLCAASLLVAPYAAGNSALVPLAIGVIPLFQSRNRRAAWAGLLLVVAADAALLINRPAFVGVVSWYWTAWLAAAWAALVWRVVAQRDQAGSPS